MNAGTPSKTLRAAIVGGGKMARHHARAIRSLGGRAVVAAVVDPVTEAREAMLELCPEAAPYESLDDALAGPGIDVVHVCSPPPTHARLALTSLQAGCSTYVEKPLAETREEARQLTRTAADRNLVLCAGHQLLFEAPAARLRELLPSIGPCVHIESYFSFRPVRRARAGGTPMRVEEQLLDVLPHPVYLLLACLRRAAPNGETELRGIEVGRSGTVHALVGRGELNASLVVSLAGRPVESYV